MAAATSVACTKRRNGQRRPAAGWAGNRGPGCVEYTSYAAPCAISSAGYSPVEGHAVGRGPFRMPDDCHFRDAKAGWCSQVNESLTPVRGWHA